MSMNAFGAWTDLNEEARTEDFHAYVSNVAEARYVMRRVLRILDERAKAERLDPLQHQALLQVFGTERSSVAMNELAERLDIAAAFASRLVKQLEVRGLLTRSPLETDRRVTLVGITADGIDLLRRIDQEVHHHIAHFQHDLGARQRSAALAVFAFYVGEPTDSPVARTIREANRAVRPEAT